MKKPCNIRLPMYKCSECGKNICILYSTIWVYKKKIGNLVNYYCSYSCYKKAGGDDGKLRKKYTRTL